MKKSQYFILIFLLPIIAFADTTFVGDYSSGIWDLEGSPYYLSRGTTIEYSDTLIIEPGVEVIFGARSIYIYEAVLFAIGTPEDSIYFTGGRESHIIVGGDSSFIELAYCQIDISEDDDDLYNGSIIISNG